MGMNPATDLPVMNSIPREGVSWQLALRTRFVQLSGVLVAIACMIYFNISREDALFTTPAAISCFFLNMINIGGMQLVKSRNTWYNKYMPSFQFLHYVFIMISMVMSVLSLFLILRCTGNSCFLLSIQTFSFLGGGIIIPLFSF